MSEVRCCSHYDLVSSKRPLHRVVAIRLFGLFYQESARKLDSLSLNKREKYVCLRPSVKCI